MSADAVQKGFYGAVVPARDLAAMRTFYRDVVQLGDPGMDSNFWVEFNLPGGGILALEHRESAQPPEQGQGIAWMLGVPKLQEVVDHLVKNEVKPLRPEQAVPGVNCRSFLDPEGNPFTVYEVGEAGAGTEA